MKRFTLSLMGMLCIALTLHAQVYVNHSAIGLNDGSSWSNAFTNLQDALDLASNDTQVWVAAGEYKPGQIPDQDGVYFLLSKSLELYGGFTGNETTVDQRDWNTNITLINGDILDDDIDGNFMDGKEDNANHNLIADSLARGSIIDGFHFSGGAAFSEDPDENSNVEIVGGGGILSLAPIEIKNCSFEQCSAVYGGAIAYRSSSVYEDFLLIENCIIQNNQGELGTIFLSNLKNGEINNCSIKNNFAENFAGGILVLNSSLDLSNSMIENNKCTLGNGGGLYASITGLNEIEEPKLRIDSCRFTSNSAANGGAFLFSNSFAGTSLEIINSDLQENIAQEVDETFGGSGGAMFIRNDPLTTGTDPTLNVSIHDTKINNNIASRAGGSYFFGANDAGLNVEVQNTSFHGNSAAVFGGGVVIGNSEGTFNHCTFERNQVDEAIGGGMFLFHNGVSNLESPLVSILNSTFLDNFAPQGAGLHYNNFVPGSRITIKGCSFTENKGGSQGIGAGVKLNNLNNFTSSSNLEASIDSTLFERNSCGTAGAMSFFSNADKIEFTISNSSFIDNQASFIGAIEMFNSGGNRMTGEISKSRIIGNTAANEIGGILCFDVNSLDIIQSEFSYNSCSSQAAAVESIISTTNIESSLFHNNTGDYTIENTGDLSLKNTTIVDNDFGILQENGQYLEIQNSIIANNNLDYDEVGSATLNSQGGNIWSDDSAESLTSNQSGYDDLFNTDPELDTLYQATNISPAIDFGNPMGIEITEDLNGNPRIQGNGIDAGAFESSFSVSTLQLSEIEVEVYPNPFVDQINISDVENIEEIQLFNNTGRMISKLPINNTIEINQNLPQGSYFIAFKIKGKYYVEKIKKM